jgi:tetratricopeptide (TPR) repeat protein
MPKQPFLEYCKDEQKNMEIALTRFNSLESIPENPNPYILSFYKRLAVSHRVQENFMDYRDSLKKISILASYFTQSKEPDYLKEEQYQNDLYLKTSHLRNTGEFQVNTGMYLVLAHGDIHKIQQLYEWAAENCNPPEEYIKSIKRNIDEIACCYLWRGYALLNLDRYEEAFDCLAKVVPILEQVKKSGREMWRTIEFALTKALIPLCEFKLHPNKDTLKKAQKGIENYIKALHNNKEKLDGYIYYFHLREQFADVYNTDPKEFSDVVPGKTKAKTVIIPVSSSESVDTPGSVIILDPGVKSKAFAIIGTNADFDQFIRSVTNLGGFPELASLMDLYTLGNPREAKLLEDDCTRFIRTPGIDPDIYETGKRICSAVRVAAREDSKIVVEYQEELDPDTPE